MLDLAIRTSGVTQGRHNRHGCSGRAWVTAGARAAVRPLRRRGRTDPAELDGVHRHVLTPYRRCASARRSGQVEGAGLTVPGSPLGDDVGDNSSVVPGVDVELPIGRAGQVDPVHPHVPGEAHVEQVPDPLPPDRLGQVQQRKSGDDTGQSAACPNRPVTARPIPRGARRWTGRRARVPGPRSSRPTRTGCRSRPSSAGPRAPDGRTHGARPGQPRTRSRALRPPARPRAGSRSAWSSRRS